MKKKLLLFAVSFLMVSCATYEVNYKNLKKFQSTSYPKDKIVSQRFYLIGDTGNDKTEGVPPGLAAFRSFAESVDTKTDKVIILGDNIYPAGLPGKGGKDREQAKSIIDQQTSALQFFEGDVHFIPGNHDWYSEGIVSLKNQKARIEETLSDQDKPWLPKPGCGMSSVDISEDVHLILLDSQWILASWDKHPLINRNCDEIKTLDQFYEEFESELKKNQNKTTLVALHHPLYTNGVHGGTYEFSKHVFPSDKKIPLPGLASLANLIRVSGGVSVQDTQNNQYQSMLDKISAIASRWNRVIFASGHEHSLQYIEHDLLKQIVSGSGSKKSYAKLGSDGLFAFPGYGFAVLDVFEDASSWVQFYSAEEDSPALIFQQEIYEGEKTYELNQLPEHFTSTYTGSIYEEFDSERTGFYESVWGQHYRDLYTRKITVPVMDIDTAYGGLRPMRVGGGMQTNSLRLEDSLGRQYNIRQIKKDPIRLLQESVYPDKNLTDEFDETVIEELLLDFMTAAHPYGFLVVPDLSEAIGVYHTNPKLVYIPKQKGLGKFNRVHGDEIYMIEERPEDHWIGTEGIFGNPNHDIVSTADMIGRLRRDEKYSLDESSYLRARLFDMLLGDWDRHEDQWRWSEFEEENGDRYFRPIPRDRDQVFANFDGGFFEVLSTVTSFPKIYHPYEDDIEHLKWFNNSGLSLDRMIIRNATAEDWRKEAAYIQENLTEEVIDKAFANLPPEIDGEKTERLMVTFKKRLKSIDDFADEYFKILNEIPVLIATDKDDFIDVYREQGGKTRVVISRNIQGERAYKIVDKVFSEEITKEIWIYGLDDEDVFTTAGAHSAPIKVRLIGGHSQDSYTLNSGKNVLVYDHKSLKNSVNENKGGRIVRTDDYVVNTFDKDRKVSQITTFLPRVGYNPDDGLLFGLQMSYAYKGFRLNPFTYRHNIKAGLYTATGGFDFGYEGEFANILGNYNLFTTLTYTSPNYARNFYGFGNGTASFENDFGRSFNRVKIRKSEFELGLRRVSKYGSTFEHKFSYQNYKVERTEGRFIDVIGDELISQDADFFDQKDFVSYQSSYQYKSFDDDLDPKRGMDFKVELGGTLNTADVDEHFFFLHPHLEFYNALSKDKKWVLRTKAASQLIFNEDYEFYQGAILGSRNGLRGYRRDRFIGSQSFVSSIDLRHSFNAIHTNVAPLQFGVFGGFDVGRVWSEVPEPNNWHNDYGVGIWVNAADVFAGTLNFFHSEDGFLFSFGFGATF
ncbi:BamA/TamA family outer membrane protein [Psychroflexus sp. YR1-1]|uniref:BamA/TamA family outer membrane protein n=1 Tax=Psychroflexus aurantiacus TaxID=2709310 RepID=A0A6B3R3F5_9FLAO|nr:metallophosphoesterase [Psychroflexus aurantiacus]NEV94070.1 BamA/TamA family outer membrane protein [Psychroflexus aurantiacus]